MKGLASDGGLFIPEAIPRLPPNWETEWKDLDFCGLAYEVFSLYICPQEIPPADLKDIIKRSYSTFRNPEVSPLVTLLGEERLHVLELFHGPTFAFKDVALQLLGNLFEYFLVRRNAKELGHSGQKRHHLTVIGATSGDTGSAAIYGLRGKKDVSVFILHPKGKISPVQEAQMTTVLDANVHNLAVDGTFDDCQDIVKALFADPIINKTQNLAAVNSINWARILAQITYYFKSYFDLTKSSVFERGNEIRFVVPTGNFGDILAGYFAKRMGLRTDKLVIATNENDILDRFWKTGHYKKRPDPGQETKCTLKNGGFKDDGAQAHEEGVRETLSPAMDILVSSNFERLLWYLAYESYGEGDETSKRRIAGEKVQSWYNDLKSKDGFTVSPEVLEIAKRDFESERVSCLQTTQIIIMIFELTLKASQAGTATGMNTSALSKGYVLDPHTAVGIEASLRSIKRAPPPRMHHVCLATAHPAKFAEAVSMALGVGGNIGGAFSFEAIQPEELKGLDLKKRRVRSVARDQGLEGMRKIIGEEVSKELAAS